MIKLVSIQYDKIKYYLCLTVILTVILNLIVTLRVSNLQLF